jgi:DNA-binding CsgD family transcriptional regulator
MLGPVVRRVSSSIFVGRVVERAQLETALDAAARGEPGVALIGGEAGIGKTRLASELTTVAGARGASVVRGHCLDARTASLPFAPFIEILRGLLLGEGARRRIEMAVPGSHALARLIPEIGSKPTIDHHPPTVEERLILFREVLELLGRTASERPLLAIVEDLHWADASSLDLLAFIARGLDTEHLLILGTFRPDEANRRHPLRPFLGELVRLPHVLRFDLQAFTEPEVADQLTGITGRRPPGQLVERVFARSDGNPFFVEELAGHRVGTPLPATLHDVLVARLAPLSADARRAVLAAAAIGREAAEELLVQVAGLPHERLSDALHEAIDRHVLVQSDPPGTNGLAFRHALIQELAYLELLPSERVALHRAIVPALQGSGGSPGEIARHALLAQDPPTSLAYSILAGDQAIEALAFAEALGHLERALELWGKVGEPETLTGRDQASLLMATARCAGALGRWTRAVDIARTALVRLDPIDRRDDRVVALLELSRWAMMVDDEIARAAAVREAAELASADPPSSLRARVLTELAHLANHTGRTAEAQRLAEEAVAVSRAIGDRAEEARALVRLAEALADLMQPEAAERILVEAERLAADGHAPFEDFLGYVLFRRANCAQLTGAFTRAVEIVDAGMARAARTGRFGERSGFYRAVKVAALAALGRWDEAEALVDEAQRAGDEGTARMAVQSFVEVLVRQGRISEAGSAARATEFRYVTSEEGWPILRARIHVANSEARWDDARAAAEEAIGLFEDPARDVDLLDILELCVRGEADRVSIARGRRRAAEAAEARSVGLARLDLVRSGAQEAIRRGGAGPLIAAQLAMAEAEGSRLEGRPDAERWDDAARRSEALGQPWETAYALFREAEAILGTRVGKDEAIPLLREANRIASELGARPLVGQIERLARRGRIRLVPVPPERRLREATTPEGVVVRLTTREWEVLSLVAAGHTNREIGEELFISEKTASVHISNAMNKLGALSRYDAAASATRLGLLAATSAESPIGLRIRPARTERSPDIAGLERGDSPR